MVENRTIDLLSSIYASPPTRLLFAYFRLLHSSLLIAHAGAAVLSSCLNAYNALIVG